MDGISDFFVLKGQKNQSYQFVLESIKASLHKNFRKRGRAWITRLEGSRFSLFSAIAPVTGHCTYSYARSWCTGTEFVLLPQVGSDGSALTSRPEIDEG